MPAQQRFREARKKVTLHYQWLVRHDYLPRIVDPAVLDDVFTNGRVLVEPDAAPTDVPTMPVEFSIAAFRLGPQHDPQQPTTGTGASRARPAGWSTCSTSPVSAARLGGDLILASNWLADWRRMYDFAAAGRPELAPPGDNVNLAKRIDTLLTDPLDQPATQHVRRAGHDPVRRRTPQPGLPQPDPGQDGPARQRPADGPEARHQGRRRRRR